MSREILSIHDTDTVTIVGFQDSRLDSIPDIETIGDRLRELADGGATSIIVDFDGVRFVASSLLGKLISLNRRTHAAGGRVVLCNLSPYLRTIFDTSRLNRIFPIRDDLEQAMATFAPRTAEARN